MHRQLSGSSRSHAPRRAGKEPLAEGIRRPRFEQGEIVTIRRIRHELIQQGLTDNGISKFLSTKLRRSMDSINLKIRSMVKSCELLPNPNKREQSGFSPEDLESILQRRPELIQQGLTDSEISRYLSRVLQRTADSIRIKIRFMRKSGELPLNPNKQEKSDFTPEDLDTIHNWRAELIKQGLTDKAISRAISIELRRSAGSIKEKIRHMVESGELPENPNKRGSKIPESEVLSQLKEAVGLYTEVSE